jgi:DNA-binding response OmpR family regulator
MKASGQQPDSLHNRNLPVVVPLRRQAYDVIVRKKILVVEDDPDLVELLSFNLRACGFVVSTSADGVDALKKARSILPDLILLDLMLPQLDGFGVCEILRRDPDTAGIPIIMVTAMSSQFARLAGLEAGANDYITKPFSPKQLIARVQEMLGRPVPQTASPLAT